MFLKTYGTGIGHVEKRGQGIVQAVYLVGHLGCIGYQVHPDGLFTLIVHFPGDKLCLTTL